MDFDQCSCSGRNLSKLIQPALMTLLAQGPQHGYLLIQDLENMTIFKGEPPDPSGVYRHLKEMEKGGFVKSSWELKESGPAKRIYSLTGPGLACLRQWIKTLEAYRQGLDELLLEASKSVDQNGRPVNINQKTI